MTYRQLLEAQRGIDALLDKKISYPKKIELYDMIQIIGDKLKGFERERVRIVKAYKDGETFKPGKSETAMIDEFDSLLNQEVTKKDPVTLTEKDFPEGTPSLREMLNCKVVRWL